MEIIIEDSLLYRHKKKWVGRYCKLVRTNSFSNSVKLLVLTNDDHKSRRIPLRLRKSPQIVSKYVVYGHLHGVHMKDQENVIFIVCKNSVECLAFKDYHTMEIWSDELAKYLQDISQSVTLVYADKYSQLKSKLEGRLLINCSHISFIRDPSYSEPKLLMSWKISDIMEYGCSKDIKKNSSKSKAKSVSIDSSQNIFIIKASPLFYQAPNHHIFSCITPKSFCDRLESISSNQENLHSPSDFDGLMQRSRTESFFLSNDLKENDLCSSDTEFSPDSGSNSTNRFFSEPNQCKTPRFQRSISEAPQRRCRIDSAYSIDEESELELTDRNVATMCQVASGSESESPLRSSTYTWLERYPFESEPSKMPNRRRTSETFNGSYRTLLSNSNCSEMRLHRPKSSSNYCSLENLRPKSKMPPDSPPFVNNLETSYPTTKEQFPLHLDKSQGLISRRSMRPNEDVKLVSVKDKPISGYVNLEFTQIFEQINKFCKINNDIDHSLKV